MIDCIPGMLADRGGSAPWLDCSTLEMTPPAINSRRMRVNDVELNVVVLGEGPEVLFVHGFPDDHTVWRNQIPALVDAARARSSRARPTTRSISSWLTWLRCSMRSG